MREPSDWHSISLKPLPESSQLQFETAPSPVTEKVAEDALTLEFSPNEQSKDESCLFFLPSGGRPRRMVLVNCARRIQIWVSIDMHNPSVIRMLPTTRKGRLATRCW